MGATPNTDHMQESLRNPGRLILGPTQLTGQFCGGVDLGPLQDGEAEVVWHEDLLQVRDPASGRLAEIGRRGATWPEIYCLIQGPKWDEDIIFAAFSRATRIASPTPTETRIEGTIIPSVVQAWPSVLFKSDDPKGKCVYLRRPILTLSLRDALAISDRKKAGLPMRFAPTPDSQWQTIPDWQIARLENILL